MAQEHALVWPLKDY